jgi:hypothetical protein
MKSTKVIVAFAMLVECVLAGCAMNKQVEIEPGVYVVVPGPGEANKIAMRVIKQMEIDRDKRIMILTLLDNSKIHAEFVPRDRAEWPTGCPTNVASTRMEVLDIEGASLTIAQLTLSNPILVRDCPSDRVRVLLRQDGQIGGGGAACNWPLECVFFRPRHILP